MKPPKPPHNSSLQPRRALRRLALIAAGLCLLAALFVLIANMAVRAAGCRIISVEQAALLKADCILVLGAGVTKSGGPSPMLADRLAAGVALYQAQAADKLLMSGDHGRKDYDEVNAMKDYAIARGIPTGDVFMDHAGFSTYESVYRCRDVFAAQKIIIVTQEYHLYRALYIAERLGLEAYGVAADQRAYAGQGLRDLREVAARAKDFLNCLIQPPPTFLGEMIPVSGDGDATND
ncbi:MAG: DUF218 domain-containing protein [Clostridia bacterium]|nr:DUF218 domain-containing protein [Clostridia bacterium]